MKTEMPLTLVSLFFDENGDGQKEELHTAAVWEEKDGAATLSYEDGEEEKTKTALSFRLAAKNEIVMTQSGAREASFVFSLAKETAGTYRVGGLADFPVSLKTKTIDNRLSFEGGGLLLDYECRVGGVRQRVRLTLRLNEENRKETP